MSNRFTTQICVGLVLAGFVAHVRWMKPENYFGFYHDDSIYLSSAQALAAGRGYILPSLPGSPPQTKYPVLYPWLLSWIWTWQPDFPANVTPATWVTTLFAGGFLVAAFHFLRQLRGVTPAAALGCMALCAFHPAFLTLSGSLLSDAAFMALALAAIVAAERAGRSERNLGLAVIAGLLAGLSAMTRSVGVAFVAGVVVAAAYRRFWSQAAATALAAAPAMAYLLFRRPELPGQMGEPGWWQTWLYYTDYAGFWRLSVQNINVLRAMLKANLVDLLVTPSELCLIRPSQGFSGTLLAVTLTSGILAGVVREARRPDGRLDVRPIHFVLLFYTPLALIWNYPIMKRFLMPFLPLFYAGLWLEAKHIASMIRQALAAGRAWSEKAVGAGCAAALVALAIAAGAQYAVHGRQALRGRSEQFARVAVEQEQAYDWIRRNTPRDARFIAIGDVSLYLHTGRQAMWPIAFTTGPMYQADSAGLEYQISHLTDVARHIGARYWVAADYDYQATAPAVVDRLRRLKAGLPRVFRSRSGAIEVYEISAWMKPPQARGFQGPHPATLPVGSAVQRAGESKGPGRP
jgi:hypothetical protein